MNIKLIWTSVIITFYLSDVYLIISTNDICPVHNPAKVDCVLY